MKEARNGNEATETQPDRPLRLPIFRKNMPVWLAIVLTVTINLMLLAL